MFFHGKRREIFRRSGHPGVPTFFRVLEGLAPPAGQGYTAALPGEAGGHPPGGNFLLVQKVTKNTLRGMKLSDLIAKGRRTVLKISPPKDPQFYGGTPRGKSVGRRRRVSSESPLRWRPLPLTWCFRQSLRPSEPAPLCGGVSRRGDSKWGPRKIEDFVGKGGTVERAHFRRQAETSDAELVPTQRSGRRGARSREQTGYGESR